MATSSEMKELLNAIREFEKSTSVELTKINAKLEQFQQRQQDIRKDIEKFEEILNEPTDGLYKRLNDIVHDIKTLSEDQTEYMESVHDVKEKVNELEDVKENLIKIAGERLENLDSTIKTNQNSKKILWTFILAAVSIAGEKIVEILHLF